MRVVIQRVSSARVTVEGKEVSRIEKGLLVFAGFKKGEKEEDLQKVRQKIVNLRIFEDNESKMNLSLKEVQGEILCVSQFTLYATVKKGRRPSFDEAELPAKANDLYDKFCFLLTEEGISVKKGIFGAYMKVELSNDGPATIAIDSQDL